MVHHRFTQLLPSKIFLTLFILEINHMNSLWAKWKKLFTYTYILWPYTCTYYWIAFATKSAIFFFLLLFISSCSSYYFYCGMKKLSRHSIFDHFHAFHSCTVLSSSFRTQLNLYYVHSKYVVDLCMFLKKLVNIFPLIIWNLMFLFNLMTNFCSNYNYTSSKER